MMPAYAWNFLIVGVCYMITLATSWKVDYPTSMLSPYWFLTLLFLSYIIGYCIVKYSKGQKMAILNTVIISIFVIFLPKEKASHINSFFPFFMLGYFLRDIILSDGHKRLQLGIMVVSLVSYLIQWQYWKFDYTVYMSPLDMSCIEHPEMLSIAVFRFSIAMSAILLVIFSFKSISFLSDNRFLNKLGSMTLGVYLMQSPVILLIGEFCPVNIESHLLRDFIVIPIISLAIYICLANIQTILCKSRILAFVLFGKAYQNGK